MKIIFSSFLILLFFCFSLSGISYRNASNHNSSPLIVEVETRILETIENAELEFFPEFRSEFSLSHDEPISFSVLINDDSRQVSWSLDRLHLAQAPPVFA